MIELLVTVTIIAILVLLIFSLARSALNAAYEGACLSNVHTYGAATLTAIADHNGMLTVPQDSGGDDLDNLFVQPYLPSGPLVCPIYQQNHPGALPFGYNNYAIEDGLARFFPAVFNIPVPHDRVVLVAEQYCGDAASNYLQLDMTMWGIDPAYYSPAETPSHQGESRVPQYHGPPAHRGLNLFMLDGSAALVCPDTGSWQGPSATYGAPGNSGYYYDYLQFEDRMW